MEKNINIEIEKIKNLVIPEEEKNMHIFNPCFYSKEDMIIFILKHFNNNTKDWAFSSEYGRNLFISRIINANKDNIELMEFLREFGEVEF